jgi:hypothetical protein
MTAPDILPLSIELGAPGTKPYKSIEHIIWNDIPSFAILTGLNGSGKTQLLQALAYRLSGAAINQVGHEHLNGMPLKVVGPITPDEIAYLPSGANSLGIDAAIRTQSPDVLQSIVDYVQQAIEPTLLGLTASERVPIAVTFSSGVQLNYPGWMLNRPGHDLLPVYQKVFGQNLMTPPRLNKSFRRVRLVPIELANILTDLQQS